MKFDFEGVNKGASNLATAAGQLDSAVQLLESAHWSGGVFGNFPESKTFTKSVVVGQREVADDIRRAVLGLQEGSTKVRADAQNVLAADSNLGQIDASSKAVGQGVTTPLSISSAVTASAPKESEEFGLKKLVDGLINDPVGTAGNVAWDIAQKGVSIGGDLAYNAVAKNLLNPILGPIRTAEFAYDIGKELAHGIVDPLGAAENIGNKVYGVAEDLVMTPIHIGEKTIGDISRTFGDVGHTLGDVVSVAQGAGGAIDSVIQDPIGTANYLANFVSSGVQNPISAIGNVVDIVAAPVDHGIKDAVNLGGDGISLVQDGVAASQYVSKVGGLLEIPATVVETGGVTALPIVAGGAAGFAVGALEDVGLL